MRNAGLRRTLSLMLGCIVWLCYDRTMRIACAQAPERPKSESSATGWGDLSGRFICDCEQLQKLQALRANRADKDDPLCGNNMQSEAYWVNPSDSGLANVVVMLRLNADQAAPVAHPDYAKTAHDTVNLTVSNCRFEPHIMALRTEQTLAVINRDERAHDIHFAPFHNTASGTPERDQTTLFHFPKAERIPFRALCNIHPWMSGWVLVRDNPYFAVTDEHGRFEIKNLPLGAWTFQFWHEKIGFLQTGRQASREVQWPKGCLTTKIETGKNSLGDLHIAAELFDSGK